MLRWKILDNQRPSIACLLVDPIRMACQMERILYMNMYSAQIISGIWYPKTIPPVLHKGKINPAHDPLRIQPPG